MRNVHYINLNKSIEISFEKQPGEFSMAGNHFHDCYEIYYLLSGKRYYFIKDRTYLVSEGNLVFINKHDLHRTIDAGASSSDRFLINFKPDFLALDDKRRLNKLLVPFTNDAGVIALTFRDRIFVEELLLKMYNEINNAGTGYEDMLTSCLTQLLIFSTRHMELNSASAAVFPNSVHEKAAPIVHYLNAHFMEPLTLNSISGLFYISPYYICKVFKEYTGFTFVEYLNSLRVKEAQKLLRERKYSIMDISEKAGFGSISHFGRVFKSVTGIPPLSYRKSCTAGKSGI